MIGAFVIITLVCFSGLIAYLGDQIGMKVGKKRISVFGLRPRYTSVLITVLTGILIATLTIFIILMINENVREALFNIQAVYQRRNELEVQLDKTRQEYDDLQQEWTAAREEYQRDIAEFERRRKELKQLNEELQNENEVLENKNAELQNRNEELQKEIAELNKTREKLENRIKNAEQEIAGLNKDINNLNEEIKNLNNEINNLNKEIVIKNQEIEKKNEEIAQANQEYQELERLSDSYFAGDIVYQRGETVYIDTIESSTSEKEVVEKVRTFLQKAKDKIQERSPDIRISLFQSREQVELLGQTILNSDSEKLIVRLISMWNVADDGIINAYFEATPDDIVYSQGEVISTKVIDASQDISGLTDSLLSLLTEVRQDAVHKGLLPDRYGEVGSIDYEAFYNIQHKIQSLQGEVEVRVTAAEDIWREYALEGRFSSSLDFEIKEAAD